MLRNGAFHISSIVVNDYDLWLWRSSRQQNSIYERDELCANYWIVRTWPNYAEGRFTKAQKREFFHTMKAQKRYYVSAKAIVIENRNNCLRNRKLFLFRRITDQCNSVQLILSPRTVITDFEKAAINAVSTIFANAYRPYFRWRNMDARKNLTFVFWRICSTCL